MTTALRIKICGITREEDVVAAARAGADVVGAVLVASSPRALSPSGAARLAAASPLPLAVVVADLTARAAAEQARAAGASIVQLHGGEPPECLRRLRAQGEWEIWKAVRVRAPEDIARAAERYAGAADALLLDGWHPSRLGGTGTGFPWEALEAIRADLPSGLRLGVAGGLGAGNVAEAVRRLRPDLVDVSSGVEASPGVKDASRVRAFVRAARQGRAAREGEDHFGDGGERG